MTFTHLDLFAGVGGFSRAVEWLGGHTVAFVEWDTWCRRVLAKHWPEGKYFGDIHTVSTDDLHGLGPIDLITGGYPCQPFSAAGKRMGANDPRHLWPEMRRVIDTVRPRYVLAENVDGHVSMGLDTVLAEMEADGYACGAVVVPAASVNALHKRNRVWIMAHACGEGVGDRRDPAGRQRWEPAKPYEPASLRPRNGEILRVRIGTTGAATTDPHPRLRDGKRWTGATGGNHANGHHPGWAEGAGRFDERGQGMAHAAGIPEPEPGHSAETERDCGNPRMEPCGRGHRQHGREPESFVAHAEARGLRRGRAPGHDGQPAQRGEGVGDAECARSQGYGNEYRLREGGEQEQVVWTGDDPAICHSCRNGSTAGLAGSQPGHEGYTGIPFDAGDEADPRRTTKPEIMCSLDPRPDGLPPGLVRRPAARSAWDNPDLIRAMWADGLWEYGLPRVVADEPERRQKLQAAGNAIVPICAYEILRVMLDGE